MLHSRDARKDCDKGKPDYLYLMDASFLEEFQSSVLHIIHRMSIKTIPLIPASNDLRLHVKSHIPHIKPPTSHYPISTTFQNTAETWEMHYGRNILTAVLRQMNSALIFPH